MKTCGPFDFALYSAGIKELLIITPLNQPQRVRKNRIRINNIVSCIASR